MKKSKSYLRATIEDVFTENPDEGDNAIIGVLVWQRIWNDYQDSDDLALLQEAFLSALSGTTVPNVQGELTRAAMRAFQADEKKKRDAAAAKKAIADRKKAAAKAAAAKKAKTAGKQSTVEEPAEDKDTATSVNLTIQAEWWSTWLNWTNQFMTGAGGAKRKIANFTRADLDYAIALRESNAAGEQAWADRLKKVRAVWDVYTDVDRLGDLPEDAVKTISGDLDVLAK